jgi:hypothetical protein
LDGPEGLALSDEHGFVAQAATRARANSTNRAPLVHRNLRAAHDTSTNDGRAWILRRKNNVRLEKNTDYFNMLNASKNKNFL